MGAILHKVVLSFIHMYKAIENLFIRFFLNYFKSVSVKVYRKGGITFNGNNPWDIKLHKPREFFSRISNQGSIGMGETYMEGLWDCDDLTELCVRILKHGVYKAYLHPWNRFLHFLELRLFNLSSTKTESLEVIQKHYDLGNDLFGSMLDPSMTYTCAYWKNAKDITQAQIDKMELIGKKLMLKPGMRVLDIGCGYGALAKHLAANYGVSVVGITISKEGYKLAKEVCEGLPIEIRLQDYRDLNEQFDRITTVGMIEHVGLKNYPDYFAAVHRCLKDDGIYLLHTVGVNHYEMPTSEPWFHTYIFPNGNLPYYKHICDNIEKKFIIEDWQNMGNDYSKTIIAWHDRFLKNWPQIQHKYGEKFFRMWKYYLCFAAGGFKARKFQLWQIVMSKNGIEGGYYAAR